MNEVYTLKELAEYLRITYSTAYKLVTTGQIKGFRAGKCWRVKKSELDAITAKTVLVND